MDKIIVQRVYNNDTNNYANINSCNYPKDPNDLEIAELDYETEIKRTNLINYADVVNYPIEWSYTFSNDDIKILKNYASDYLKNTLIKNVLIKNNEQLFFDKFAQKWREGNWFFRFNSISPKDGVPDYPVSNIYDVINKIITSKRAFNSMLDGENTIYFVKYDQEWDKKREFRVFVYHQKVTAISQYNISTKSILSGKSNNEAKQLALGIKKYLEEDILPNVCNKIGTNNVVCDIYINKDMSYRIVEFNSFGYWLAAGSALYDWLDDKEKIYNTNDTTYIRFVK